MLSDVGSAGGDGGRGGGGEGEGELASVLGIQYIFIKEKWIYTITRHHANNILLTRIALHCFIIA